MLGVDLEPWQAQVLNAVLVLPSWPERSDSTTDRVEAVLTPEQRARADWGRWRAQREPLSGDGS